MPSKEKKPWTAKVTLHPDGGFRLALYCFYRDMETGNSGRKTFLIDDDEREPLEALARQINGDDDERRMRMAANDLLDAIERAGALLRDKEKFRPEYIIKQSEQILRAAHARNARIVKRPEAGDA